MLQYGAAPRIPQPAQMHHKQAETPPPPFINLLFDLVGQSTSPVKVVPRHTLPQVEDGKFGTETWGLSSMQGRRPTMEDAHAAKPFRTRAGECQVFGVFDGHGGEAVAKFCARRLPVELEMQCEDGRDLKPALEATFQLVDQQMRSEWGKQELQQLSGSSGKFDPSMVGSTAVICCLCNDEIVVANAGDSRVVLCRAGEAMELSTDNKPNCPAEEQRIWKAGHRVTQQKVQINSKVVDIYRVDGDLALSRALGDFRFKHPCMKPDEQAVSCIPDVRRTPRRRHEDEFIVMACDGVWDVMSSDEVCRIIRTFLPKVRQGRMRASELASYVVEMCLQRGSQDNMTLLLLVLEMQPASQPSALVKAQNVIEDLIIPRKANGPPLMGGA